MFRCFLDTGHFLVEEVRGERLQKRQLFEKFLKKSVCNLYRRNSFSHPFSNTLKKRGWLIVFLVLILGMFFFRKMSVMDMPGSFILKHSHFLLLLTIVT